MSANNQILVKEHNGKHYVFGNIMAESWDDVNRLSLDKATEVFDDYEKAIVFAHELDHEEMTEYGVWDGHLAKDGAEVLLD